MQAYKFAVPMRKHPNCDFSYAGLKTSVRLAIEALGSPPSTVGVDSNDVPSGSGRGNDAPSCNDTTDAASVAGSAELEAALLMKSKADIAASFQNTACIHLTERVKRGVGWAKEMDPGIK
jgi:N6-L-threonylcarbamoyladenine synthase